MKNKLTETPDDRTRRNTWTLPIKTRSLCPECLAVIDADIVEAEGAVVMHKECPSHGPFTEHISSDARFYKLMLSRDWPLNRHVSNPIVTDPAPCPNGCGICSEHLTIPIMLNVDLTNRCNLNCPVCFANSAATGKVMELSLDQVRRMLDTMCSVDPNKPACIQYAGGEPTIHPGFIEALREADIRQFGQIQVATNGLKFARDPEFAMEAGAAGLNVAYLQFDGLDDNIYRQTRGRPLLDIKLQAIDNLYRAGVHTMLVPTIIRGVNDDQIGPITRFAVENITKIIGISWQPVAFTGRIDHEQRLAQRFTVTDLAREIERQTGLVDMYRDWFPFSFVGPFTKLLEAVTGRRQLAVGCNPACGLATYLVADEDGKRVVPLPSFVDGDGFMNRVAEIADELNKRKRFRKLGMARKLHDLKSFFHQERAPSGWTFDDFVEFMMRFVDLRTLNEHTGQAGIIKEKPNRVLLLASMHFQDVYNYQLDRVQRCIVHYAAPDGRIYPFCTYNSGPCHRERVEQQFARSVMRQAIPAPVQS